MMRNEGERMTTKTHPKTTSAKDSKGSALLTPRERNSMSRQILSLMLDRERMQREREGGEFRVRTAA
jgi:hypothetical protein